MKCDYFGGGIQGDVIVRRIIREMIQKELKYLFSNSGIERV